MKLFISKDQFISVLKGAAIAAAGAALTAFAQVVSGADFGQFTPAIVAVCSTLVNYVRKMLTAEG